jgi:hypothetical protein
MTFRVDPGFFTQAITLYFDSQSAAQRRQIGRDLRFVLLQMSVSARLTERWTTMI